MLRVALIDGDIAIRAGRRLMIDSQPNLLLVFEESQAQIALEKIPDLLVDVIVVDHRLQGFDGLELARRLVDAFSEKSERCPTLVITGTYATPELVIAAIRSGASDVVTQDAPMSELLTAINNAGEAKMFANFSSLEAVLDQAEYRPSADPLFVLRRSQLCERLKAVLDCLDSELSPDQVAKELGLPMADLESLLSDLLIELHFATHEQLYLALHDSRVGR